MSNKEYGYMWYHDGGGDPIEGWLVVMHRIYHGVACVCCRVSCFGHARADEALLMLQGGVICIDDI